MPMDPKVACRVAKVETRNTAAKHDIRKIFSGCGEILEIHPYSTAKPNERHYFVEFQHPEGVKRACKLGTHDVEVFTLVESSHLVGHYYSLVQLKSLQESNHDLITFPGLTLESTVDSQQGKLPRVGDFAFDKFPAQSNSADLNTTAPRLSLCSPLSMPMQLLPSPASTPSGSLLGKLKSCQLSISTRCAPRDGMGMAATALHKRLGSPPPPFPLLISTSKAPVSTPNQLPTPVSPTRPLPPASSLIFSLETRIVMSLCGELIMYDLQTLEDDPRAIMDLLKATASERGNWMIVACHYRRKGKVDAAITVVTSMLEVMAENGIPESDLKPAFLMLSGCETELARRKARSNSRSSAEHANKAKCWLQKVYGVNTPASVSPVSSNALGLDFADTASTTPTQPRGSAPSKVKTIPDRPRHKLLVDARKSAGLPIAIDSLPPSASHIQILQREIDSLRDNQSNHSNLLSKINTGKRKLEDDLASERNARRKLEMNLEDAERDLKIAKKMEAFALQQVKKEVDTRRKAEARVEVEKGKRREAEKALESRAVKPLLEDLANMFQRAAKGEEAVLSGLSVGSSKGSSKRT